jgi:chorismate mutase
MLFRAWCDRVELTVEKLPDGRRYRTNLIRISIQLDELNERLSHLREIAGIKAARGKRRRPAR